MRTAPRPRARARGRALACLLTVVALGTAAAQADPPAEAAELGPAQAAALRSLLTAVDDHPTIEGARAGLRAAERELDATRSPVSVEASYGGSRIATEADDRWEDTLSIDARLRPVAFGDVADAEGRAQVAVERARLDLRSARAELQANAVGAAADWLAARRALDLAEQSLAVARRAREATAVRAERGAADPIELERAALEVERAEAGVADAELQLELARATLSDLVGDHRLDELPDLPAATGGAPGVRRARLDLRSARIGRDAAQRDLVPTAQASYAWNTGDGALSVSLESRTLQPTVGYEHPGRFGSAGGASGGASLRPAQARPPDVEGVFTIGVSMTLSPERLYAAQAADARIEGAEGALAAARQRNEAGARGRDGAVASAARSVELARRERDLAQRELEASRDREALGLESPLAVAQRELALREAERALFDARVNHLSRVLDTYRDTATPLSEVLP